MATSRVCSIPDCGKPLDALGLCKKHYERVRRARKPKRERTPRAEQSCHWEGCARPVYAKSACLPHYRRQRKRPGDFSPLNSGTGEAREHYFGLLSTEEFPDTCVEWPFAKTRGYGSVHINGRTLRVHAEMAAKVHGARPKGHFACHTCDNPSCVNPRHLYWGTPTENAMDAVTRRRRALGEAAPHAKLTEAMALEIRNGSEPIKSLARRFGVDKARISRIRNGKAWRHIS